MTYVKYNGKRRYIPYYYVYVLELQNGKYYVGLSRNVDKRFECHKSGNGAKYTKIYQPIRVIETLQTAYCSYSKSGPREDEKTLEYMRKHGRGNVRGGIYSAVDQQVVDDLLGKEFCAEVPLHIKAKKKHKNQKKDKEAKRNKTPAELGLELRVVEKIPQKQSKISRPYMLQRDNIRSKIEQIFVYVDYKKKVGYVSNYQYAMCKREIDRIFRVKQEEEEK